MLICLWYLAFRSTTQLWNGPLARRPAGVAAWEKLNFPSSDFPYDGLGGRKIGSTCVSSTFSRSFSSVGKTLPSSPILYPPLTTERYGKMRISLRWWCLVALRKECDKFWKVASFCEHALVNANGESRFVSHPSTYVCPSTCSSRGVKREEKLTFFG